MGGGAGRAEWDTPLEMRSLRLAGRPAVMSNRSRSVATMRGLAATHVLCCAASVLASLAGEPASGGDNTLALLMAFLGLVLPVFLPRMTWLRMSLRVSASVLSRVVETMNWTVTGPMWMVSPRYSFPSYHRRGINSLACVLVSAMAVICKGPARTGNEGHRDCFPKAEDGKQQRKGAGWPFPFSTV